VKLRHEHPSCTTQENGTYKLEDIQTGTAGIGEETHPNKEVTTETNTMDTVPLVGYLQQNKKRRGPRVKNVDLKP
jgi:hypothetical protein